MLLGSLHWSSGIASGRESNRTIEQFKTELDLLVPQLQQKYGVPGVAIGMIHNGEIAYQLSYGYANIQSKQEITENIAFQAASVSKSLTAWGVMQLVQQGKLELKQPVDHYLTRWQLPSSTYDLSGVTIERILSHTAGLGVHGYLGSAKLSLPTLEQSLSGEGLFSKSVTVETEPGTEFIYSGGGYTLLQLVIEEVTGMKFEAYMKQNVLEPLGMNDSSFQPSSVADRVATPYGYFNNPIPLYQFTEQAAAGLYTTAHDMMQFMILGMQLGNTSRNTEVMSGDILREMQEPILDSSALGIFVKPLSDGNMLHYHPGDNRGFHSFYGYIPESGEGLVILTNSENGRELRQDIYNEWIAFTTGTLPIDHDSFSSQRNIYIGIAIMLGILLGLYVMIFVKKCIQGNRAFFTQHTNKRYVWVTLRTVVLLCTLLTLYMTGYKWALLHLYLGIKYIYILVMGWLVTAMLVGFYPKRKRTIQQNEAIEI